MLQQLYKQHYKSLNEYALVLLSGEAYWTNHSRKFFFMIEAPPSTSTSNSITRRPSRTPKRRRGVDSDDECESVAETLQQVRQLLDGVTNDMQKV